MISDVMSGYDEPAGVKQFPACPPAPVHFSEHGRPRPADPHAPSEVARGIAMFPDQDALVAIVGSELAAFLSHLRDTWPEQEQELGRHVCSRNVWDDPASRVEFEQVVQWRTQMEIAEFSAVLLRPLSPQWFVVPLTGGATSLGLFSEEHKAPPEAMRPVAEDYIHPPEEGCVYVLVLWGRAIPLHPAAAAPVQPGQE